MAPPAKRFNARKRLAHALRSRRLALHLTQEELSAVSGLKQSYISELEAARRNVSIDNIEKLALALDLDIADLLAQS